MFRESAERAYERYAVDLNTILATSSTRWNGSIGLFRYASNPLAWSPLAGNADSGHPDLVPKPRRLARPSL